MLKLTIFLLYFHNLIIPSNAACISDSEACTNDTICFTKQFDHEEGRVEFSGCISSLDKPHAKACFDALEATKGDICIENGLRKLCCCESSDQNTTCNQKWVAKSALPDYTSNEVRYWVAYMLFSIMLIWCTAYVSFEFFRRYLNRVSRDSPTRLEPDATATITRFEKVTSVIILVTLGCLHSSMWFPISFSCIDHTEGHFSHPNRFQLQIFEYTAFSLIFAWLAMLMTLLEINRFYVMVWKPLISRATFSIIYTILSLLFVPVLVRFVFEIEIMQNSSNKMKYCEMTKSMWQVQACWALVALYLCVTVLREFIAVIIYKSGVEPESEKRIDSKLIPMDVTLSSALSTAFSHTSILENEHVVIQPKPFTLDLRGEALLMIHNNHPHEWIALRVLVSAPRHYSIHPSKMVLPPTRQVSISVRLLKCSSYPPAPHGLMIEWFGVGNQCPPLSPPLLWTRPYFRPRSTWNFYVLPIYHEGIPYSQENDETDNSAVFYANM